MAISRRLHNRRRSRIGGRPSRSVCPTFKSAEECSDITICKWNAKSSKCGKAPVKRLSKSQAKKTLKCMSSKTKQECDKNKCLWGDMLGCTSFAPRQAKL